MSPRYRKRDRTAVIRQRSERFSSFWVSSAQRKKAIEGAKSGSDRRTPVRFALLHQTSHNIIHETEPRRGLVGG